jgi:type IV pilus assembly protein PilQ
MKKLIVILILFGLMLTTHGQIDLKDKLKGYVSPDELVTLSESISFDQALQVISKVSEKVSGKKVVSPVSITMPIGIEIDKMQYKKALMIIVQYNNLYIEETESTIIIRKKGDVKGIGDSSLVSIDEREVKISAVMFEANIAEMREQGINWEFLLSQTGLSVGGKLVSVQDQTSTSSGTSTAAGQTTQNPPQFNLNSKSTFSMGPFDGTATALFKFFEDENLGKIISRPVITAINKKQGRTQIGSDFSIKERDFAGNLIDKFYQSGTIIEVTPNIMTEEGIDYVYLKVRMERSSVVIGSLSIEKPKTEVVTNLLLLNGEETAIGGLITNEETTVRRGVPFLKDLPWWVLGLRYIFGYDQVSYSQKEIILLIKADILPTLKERFSKPKEQTLLKKTLDQQRDDLEKYKEQIKKKEEEIK